MEEEQAPLVTVPTALLRKRKELNKERVAKAIAKRLQERKTAKKGKPDFKRAEYFLNESFRTNMQKIRLGRLKHQTINVPEDVKVAFVMRIASIPGQMPLKVRKVLQMLRLTEHNNAVICKISDQFIEQIKLVEPYVTWGYPSLRSVHDLIFKYGYGDVEGVRSALSSNVLIEDKFSGLGMLCLDDVVAEVFNAGRHFEQVQQFLHPFKLTPPKGGFKRIKKHFKKNGDYGNRAEKINTLVRKML